MEPVSRLFVRTDSWEWVLGSGDLDMITLWKDVSTHYQTVNPNYTYVSAQLSPDRRMTPRRCCVS